LCRVIAAVRDPDPAVIERLATGAGDLAEAVASFLRHVSTASAQTRDPWRVATSSADGGGHEPGYTAAQHDAAGDAGMREDAAREGSDAAGRPAAKKPMAKKAVTKKVVAAKAGPEKAEPQKAEPQKAEPAAGDSPQTTDVAGEAAPGPKKTVAKKAVPPKASREKAG
jgi:hypothetical protein